MPLNPNRKFKPGIISKSVRISRAIAEREKSALALERYISLNKNYENVSAERSELKRHIERIKKLVELKNKHFGKIKN